MKGDIEFGTILDGRRADLEASASRFAALPVDEVWRDSSPYPPHGKARTIGRSVEVSAPGTYEKKSIRNLKLEPTDRPGWWFDRTDLPDSQPIKVDVRNVWTTGDVVSSIVLRSGSVHNYVRLVEHIIALKAGMDVDNLMIRFGSGDPPLFNHGAKELVEAIDSAGRRETDAPVRYLTVREPVTILTPYDGFMTFSPCEPGRRELRIDCARDFPNAIGQQRIQFVLNESSFRHGATARTNTTAKQKLFVTTIGKLFANMRNLGYNSRNVLIAAKSRYVNEARLIHNGKSLEAAWHRAVLDLLAALALIDHGRFVGDIIDHKGCHYADVEMIKLLYANDLLVEV